MTTLPQRALLALLLLGTGCRFTFLQDDLERIQRQATLAGDVVVDDWEDAPIVIAVIEPPDRRGDPIRVLRSLVLERPGRYAFQLEEGDYVVVAFEDVNRNERIDEGEQGTWLPAVHLDVRQEVHDHDVRIDRPFPHRDIDTSTLVDDRQRINGEVAALSDERLGARAGITGVWQPLVMMERYHPGLYLLEEYDADKTPVLFVPGLGGNAQEFAAMIAALDGERFQPWVYTYPSGMRLGVNATALHAALHEAHVRYPYERICLVTHSVGGVIVRDTIGQVARDGWDLPIRLLVTVAAPAGGIPFAQTGVNLSPEVVPAWHDLVPGSGYLRSLYQTPLPDEVEHHLLFTYAAAAPSDGVVLIHSQLRREAQREAVVVRGFETTHALALEHELLIRQVKLAVDRCRGDRPDAPLVADRRRDRGTLR